MNIGVKTIGFVLLAAGCALAQDWADDVRRLRPAESGSGETAVLDSLERRARQALDPIPHARTRADADRARPALRRRLAQSLGYRQFPWPPRLDARTVGELRRPGYRIEKIVYHTFPGTLVPAHLYLPETVRGRAPAVLFYTGHWWADAKTRPDFQAFCINMARFGFAVLTFDAFGQGERGISNRDHRRTEGLLAGVSQQGFAEYETQCALEYLRSRKEVDPERIGMTGASGGGYNTWITAALDDRINTAVPVVGTSDFYEQLSVCRALDWYKANEHCHFVAGLIRYANNHEFVAMAAPRPLLVVAATQDQSFPIAGVRKIAEYGRNLYTAYGAGQRFGFFEDSSSGHGYQQPKREAAYGWFLRWLLGRGDGKPVPEPATETEASNSAELRCFAPGENQAAGPGMVEAIRRIAATIKGGADAGEPLHRKAPAADIALASARVQRFDIPVEPGLRVPGFLVRGDRGVLVAIDDRGKEALAGDPYVHARADAGWAVAGIDPRGFGELATTKPGWVFAVSLLLDENFVRRQAGDVAAAVDALARAMPGKPIALYARGQNASLAATYTLEMGRARIHSFRLKDGFVSLRQFLDRPASLQASFALKTEDTFRGDVYDREIPYMYLPFGGLRGRDLDDIWAASGAAGEIVNPIDGDWNRMKEAEARRAVHGPIRIEIE